MRGPLYGCVFDRKSSEKYIFNGNLSAERATFQSSNNGAAILEEASIKAISP